AAAVPAAAVPAAAVPAAAVPAAVVPAAVVPAAVVPAAVVPAAVVTAETVTAETVPGQTVPAASEAPDPVIEAVLGGGESLPGYPRELLALDLDLGADVGVDTVKQAGVFAAVRERFAIPRQDSLKLRDFPTLAHVIGFVRDHAKPAPQAAGSAEAARPPEAAGSAEAAKVPPDPPAPGPRPPH